MGFINQSITGGHHPFQAMETLLRRWDHCAETRRQALESEVGQALDEARATVDINIQKSHWLDFVVGLKLGLATYLDYRWL